ncbi:unnamed protein product, partial [Musa acuminata subsp. burmannicoides]
DHHFHRWRRGAAKERRGFEDFRVGVSDHESINGARGLPRFRRGCAALFTLHRDRTSGAPLARRRGQRRRGVFETPGTLRRWRRRPRSGRRN